MKKVVLLLIVLLTAAVASAYAHPPTDIKITFDLETHVLWVVISHDVKNPQEHFIKEVDVGFNGKEIISHVISRQDSNDSQTVSYLIPDAKAGDILSVEGYCSISGKFEKDIKVE